jgi:hypothetical protein
VNQPAARSIPSSVSNLAAVWLVVFTLVLHEVGFAWATGMIAAIVLCALYLGSFLVIRAVRERRSPRE